MLADFLHIPGFIANNAFGVLIVGFITLFIGIYANLWRLLYGDVIRLMDWDDWLVYIGIILIALSLVSIF